jgi:ribosomal protein S18 acetylase RimI-like enzyme
MNLARSRIRVPANVTIRPARDADLKLLAHWNTSIDRVVEPTLRRQNAGKAVVLLALVEPWPVGHLLVDFVALASENAAHLWHMGVHDSVISRGIGSQLIATAERMSAERGLRNSALEVETTNTDALRLYQRLGYAIVGERDEFWPEPDERGELQEVGHPCWLMRKDISGARSSSDRPELSPWARSPSRCPRPELSPQLLAAVRQAHGIAWAEEPVDLGGSSNLNLRLRAEEGHADHVLRVHRAWVTSDRLSAIHSVRRHLAERGLPVVEAKRCSPAYRGWLGCMPS